MPVEMSKIDSQTAKLIGKVEECGVKVVDVVFDEEDAPAKLFFEMSGVPMAQARLALERANFDVGHRMQDEKLCFYATQRKQPRRGWL